MAWTSTPLWFRLLGGMVMLGLLVYAWIFTIDNEGIIDLERGFHALAALGAGMRHELDLQGARHCAIAQVSDVDGE